PVASGRATQSAHTALYALNVPRPPPCQGYEVVVACFSTASTKPQRLGPISILRRRPLRLSTPTQFWNARGTGNRRELPPEQAGRGTRGRFRVWQRSSHSSSEAQPRSRRCPHWPDRDPSGLAETARSSSPSVAAGLRCNALWVGFSVQIKARLNQ